VWIYGIEEGLEWMVWGRGLSSLACSGDLLVDFDRKTRDSIRAHLDSGVDGEGCRHIIPVGRGSPRVPNTNDTLPGLGDEGAYRVGSLGIGESREALT
jgi:hypothetical protein